MIEANEIVASVESTHISHPRGDCFYYCYLLQDRTVVFGDVFGNYAFSESNRISPTSTAFVDRMNYYKDKKPDFYNKVRAMLVAHKIIADRKKSALDYY